MIHELTGDNGLGPYQRMGRNVSRILMMVVAHMTVEGHVGRRERSVGVVSRDCVVTDGWGTDFRAPSEFQLNWRHWLIMLIRGHECEEDDGDHRGS